MAGETAEVSPDSVPRELGTEEAAPSLDAALAHALSLAAEAGRWDVVAQLAAELEARRVVMR